MGVTLIYLRHQGMLSRLLINNELGLKGEICWPARCLDAWKKIMPQPKSRKIAVLGYRSVGKSSLTIQFVEGQFVDSYDPTIENTFTKTITVSGQEYHLQLVDTAGQDEYSIFPQSYTIDVDGYILLFSVTSYKSFEVVRVIHEKLLDMVGNLQVPIILVGNKKDLHMERVISFEEGRALAESWSAPFLESSAKENQTAVEVFRRMILEVEKMEAGQPPGRTSCLIM
ncbi:GTP-binding protein Rheb [Gadus macrocephalus]|uniref:GTP-binding protein Rheb n=1 Tax=Gadus macrocephalus TaxID=80720 RepID=UPI0028CB3CE5|nr:GTP-binding protein Rheb [Gadus macrocephalus]